MPTASAETTTRHEHEAHAAVAAWTREKKARLGPVAGSAPAPRAAQEPVPADLSDWGAMDA